MFWGFVMGGRFIILKVLSGKLRMIIGWVKLDLEDWDVFFEGIRYLRFRSNNIGLYNNRFIVVTGRELLLQDRAFLEVV